MDYNLYMLKGTDGSVADTFASGGEIWYSPTIGDVNDDGRKDIVFSATDNLMYAIDGVRDSLLWTCPSGGPDRPWFALGDVDGDGRPEVISVLGGYVRALNGEDGSPRWSFPALIGWSAPVIADVNGDRALEVVFGDDDSSICALHGSDGTLLWSFPTDGWTSEPALGDIDSDGRIEVVVGSYEGRLYALDGSLSGTRESQAGRELLRLSLSPNPASGSAVIRTRSLRHPQFASSSHDCAGRLVRMLVNGYHPAGSYSYSLLTTPYSLPGGVYFCRLIADGSCVDRKLTIAR